MEKHKQLGIVLSFLLLFSVFSGGKYTVNAANSKETLPKHEMRAAWISTVVNIDLKPGMKEEEYRQWVNETVGMLKEKNFNTIVFQVKPTSDALYPSELAPWSKYITGQTQGTDPGYDPLQIMLDSAHENGLELHAWINPYRVTMASDKLEDLHEDNIAVKNPEWVIQHGSQYYLNPGLPGVKDYLVSTVGELVSNYDVDAVHMDDYFYPGVNFDDEETYIEYGGNFSTIEDWRRDNVNQLVSEINNKIKNVKPWVQFGISPSGIWRNDLDDPTGSATNGSAHYDNLFADSRQWIIDGSIDYITPQIYWSRKLSVARYDILAEWWGNQVNTHAKKHPVNLYIGMADYKVNDNFDVEWNNPRELVEQVLENRNNNLIKGQMHFTLRDIKNNPIGYQTLVSDEAYHYTSLTPAHEWNGSTTPESPTSVSVAENDDNIELKIQNEAGVARKYVIYRFNNDKEVDYSDPRNIVDVVYHRDNGATYIDFDADKKEEYVYGVTTVSNTGIESERATELSWPVKVVEKDRLLETIEEINGLNAEKYTEDSWNLLLTVFQEAEIVMSSEDVTQEEIDEITERLQELINQLVVYTVNSEQLDELLKSASKLAEEDYNESSWLLFMEIYNQAKQLIVKDQVTQEEIDNQAKLLKGAIDSLIAIDSTELFELIESIKALKESDYESQSWDNLQKILDYVMTQLSNKDIRQTDLDQLVKDLALAVEQLKIIEIENEGGQADTKPAPEVETPLDKEEQGLNDETVEEEVGKGSGNKLPQTATNHYQILTVGFLVLLIGSILLVLRRRKLGIER